MTKLSKIATSFIDWGIIFTLVLVPLVFCTKLGNQFILPKVALFRTIVTLMFIAWLIVIIEEKKIKFYQVKFAIPLAVICFFYILSTIFSLDFRASFWGYNNRLDGLYTFIFLIIFFFLVANNFKDSKKIEKTIDYIIYISLPIALYGIAQHFGIDFISAWMTDVSTRVTSTFGNAMYLAAFLIIVMPLTLAWIFYRKKNSTRLFLVIIFIVQLTALLFTQTRSAWLGLIGAILFFFILLGLKARKRVIWIGIILLICLVSGLIGSIFISNNPIHSVENKYIKRFVSSFTIRDASSLSRLTVWKMSLRIIFDRPLLGYGSGTFMYVFNSNYPSSLVKYDTQDYDYAHNQLLDWAVSYGLVSLLTFIFLLVYFFYTGIKIVFRNKNSLHSWLIIGTLSSVLGYQIMNIFGIFEITSMIYFFFFIGLIATLWHLEYKLKDEEKEILTNKYQIEKIRDKKLIVLYVLLIIIALYVIVWFEVLPLVASSYHQKTIEAVSIEERHKNYYIATNLSKAQLNLDFFPVLIDEFFKVVAKLPNADKERDKEMYINYFREITDEAERIQNKHPKFFPAYILQAKAYNYWGINFEPEKLGLVDDIYNVLAQLAPTKQQVYWEWGKDLLLRGDNERAIEKFQYAVELDPTVKKSYQELSWAYQQIGNQEEADKAMEKYNEL
jgi:putative inorganic carbon (HCO3(-)) transporter